MLEKNEKIKNENRMTHVLPSHFYLNYFCSLNTNSCVKNDIYLFLFWNAKLGFFFFFIQGLYEKILVKNSYI